MNNGITLLILYIDYNIFVFEFVLMFMYIYETL